MSDDARSAITLALAVWGSITGTAALGLRILGHRKDRTRLLVRPEFEYITWDIPPDPRLHVRVINTGRRPATVDKVYAVFQAPNVFAQIRWWWRKTSTFPLAGRDASREITEGSEAVFTFKDTGYASLGLQDIRRIVVHDKVGRTWKSGRKFGEQDLREALAAELLDEQSRGDENRRRAHVRLYKIGKDFHILIRIRAGTRMNTHRRTYRKRSDADAAMTTFLERSEQYIAGDLEYDKVSQF